MPRWPPRAIFIDFVNLLGALGLSWAVLGCLLGLLGVLLAVSWPFFGRSKPSFFQALAQNGLQEGFWIDLGSLWEGFGKVLGGFWEDFGRILNGFREDFGKNF